MAENDPRIREVMDQFQGLFESFFGGTKPAVVKDIQSTVFVTRDEQSNGVRRAIEYVRKERCSSCVGLSGPRCPECAGALLVDRTTRLRVMIPAQIEEGQVLRIRGKGNQGLIGQGPDLVGQAGDLYLTIRLLPAVDSLPSDEKGEWVKVTVSTEQARKGVTATIERDEQRFTHVVQPNTKHNSSTTMRGVLPPSAASADANSYREGAEWRDLHVVHHVLPPEPVVGWKAYRGLILVVLGVLLTATLAVCSYAADRG